MPRTDQHRKRGKRDYIAYTEETLQKCLEAVPLGSLSINKATKEYNIPRDTIKNKLRNIHSKSVGRPTVFTKLEEELFTLRVKTMCNWGFLLDKLDLPRFDKQDCNKYLKKACSNQQGTVTRIT